MKHNNVLPNAHFKKDWDKRVKTWFDQAGQKRRRRLLRKAKAAAIAPRPACGLLRPVVHCTTQKYNMKTRMGRGFTLKELKARFSFSDSRIGGWNQPQRGRDHRHCRGLPQNQQVCMLVVYN